MNKKTFRFRTFIFQIIQIVLVPGIFLLSGCTKQVSTQCLTTAIDSELKSGKQLIKIGNRTIYEGELQAISEITPGFKVGWDDPEQRQKLLNSIIEQELFLQKAQESNLLTNNQRLQKNLWVQIRNYQAGTYLLQEVDKRARSQYEKDKDHLYSQIELKDIVILYNQNHTDPTDNEKQVAMQKAEQIYKKLNAENFSQIASIETDNPIAKANGGNIGSVNQIDQRIKMMGWGPLIDQAFAMKKGEISKPIATNEGVHIVEIASDKQVQTFEDVLPFIRNQIESDVKREVLDEMLQEKKIQYLDSSLDPKAK